MHPCSRTLGEEALVQLATEARASLVGGDTDEVDVRLVGIRLRDEPDKEAGERPSSRSATKLVPSKWRKNSFGSIGAMSRPSHQALTWSMTRP